VSVSAFFGGELNNLLMTVGVKDQAVLRGVKEDKEKVKFHLACNRFCFPSLSQYPYPIHPSPTSFSLPTVSLPSNER
jgi:hypothetical protein